MDKTKLSRNFQTHCAKRVIGHRNAQCMGCAIGYPIRDNGRGRGRVNATTTRRGLSAKVRNAARSSPRARTAACTGGASEETNSGHRANLPSILSYLILSISNKRRFCRLFHVAFFISSQALNTKNLKVRGKQKKTTQLPQRDTFSIDSLVVYRLFWMDAQAQDRGSIPGHVARQTSGEKKGKMSFLSW
jgi:hypothetical protein